ncbi:MAG: helix-turn-helix domain-containing protein, partial [Candidatus Eremiobacteraeota bacterium]|nr:helix-turn-helix domain-containing protein [Candidatus Eremiobacteraeota bacterium]
MKRASGQPARRLAKAIVRQRKRLGLTQESAAFEAELSVRHYQHIESGSANPRFGSLLTIARALRLRLSALL